MGQFEYVQCVIKALWEECLRRVSLNMSLAISCDWMSICSDWNNLGHDLHHLAFRSKAVQTFFGENKYMGLRVSDRVVTIPSVFQYIAS